MSLQPIRPIHCFRYVYWWPLAPQWILVSLVLWSDLTFLVPSDREVLMTSVRPGNYRWPRVVQQGFLWDASQNDYEWFILSHYIILILLLLLNYYCILLLLFHNIHHTNIHHNNIHHIIIVPWWECPNPSRRGGLQIHVCGFSQRRELASARARARWASAKTEHE